jgi:hypothetical protein
MSNSVNLIIFNLISQHLIYKALEEKFSDEPQLNFQVIRSYKDVSQALSEKRQGILFFKIENKSDFVQSLYILRKNLDYIREGLVRPICLIAFKSTKLEKLLTKYGTTDILPLSVQAKTINLKTELLVKTIKAALVNAIELNHMTVESRKAANHALVETESVTRDFDEAISSWDDIIEEDVLETVADLEKEIGSYPGIKLTKDEPSPNLVEVATDKGQKEYINVETGKMDIAMVLSDQGQESLQCVFESFEEDHLVLEINDVAKVAIGDSIPVSVKFLYNRCKVEIDLEGKVEEIDFCSEGRKQVSLRFNQVENQRYQYFMELYAKRQDSIDEFMELAKGQ